ncbi:MAG: hypothetical protein A2156_05955 [Deltaproteobacteria bacterium RBG_16_48_10]|nr:MAG: hypothetical protein A2156_05955 [Deltaproteobacteria bacterium RBG_16_48_10]
MVEKQWTRYRQNELETMAKTLKENLRLKGDPIALAWGMEPPSGLSPYTGNLKLAHCQFMQRSRFLGETFVLTLESNFQGCSGYSYIGLGDPPPTLKTGYLHSRLPDGTPGIFGTPAASRRCLRNYYWIEPNTAKYFSCAPLSNCPFEPDVVTIVGDARACTYAVRAGIYYRGGVVSGETGPGSCSTSWVAAYLTGEIKYTLGCHGAFGIMGIDPSEILLTFPMEWLPETCAVLKEWKERGKPMFYEDPPNEERPWMKVSYEGPYEENPVYGTPK